MALFGSSTFLDRDTEDWHFETWAWLLGRLGGHAALQSTPLVTPTREFFPPTSAQGHDRALHTFDCVKTAMGMAAWPCQLVADEAPPAAVSVGEFWTLQRPGAAAGTFSVDAQTVLITYAPDLLQDPGRLVATFAHELSHYLLAGLEAEPPGGEDLHELATDLTVAYAGFGVFGANAAFHFQQFSETGRQGWSTQRSGYLSERTWALALATFLALTGRKGEAAAWLKPAVKNQVRDAERYLARNPKRLEPLRAIA